MVDVLELKPLKKKNLNLYLVESEFPIDWYFEKKKNAHNKEDDLIWNLNIVSKEYLNLVEDYLEKYNPDFVVEEKGDRSENFPNNDPLKRLIEEKNIAYHLVDISQNAEDYLRATLDQHRYLIEQLEMKIKYLIDKNGGIPENNELFNQLILWKKYLEDEYSDQENEVRYKVREAWMMMKIVNLARKLKKEKLKGLFICDARHFEGIKDLSQDLNVKTTEIKLKKQVMVENAPLLVNTNGSVNISKETQKKKR
ncbi:MAG: hypothetical protein P8Y70_05040 [Candidatus Lokiarchaeota archaeon]